MGLVAALAEWCRRELLREECRREFEAMRRRQPALARYASPLEVLVPLDRRLSGPASRALLAERDALLLSVLAERRGEPGARAPTLLLIVAFTPALKALASRLVAHGPQGGARDAIGDVVEVFLDTAWSYPFDQRHQVAGVLMQRTSWRILRRRKHERRRRDAEGRVGEALFGASEAERRSVHDTLLDLQAKGAWTPDADDRSDAIRALDRLVHRGVLSEIDRRLIVETNLHERELKADVMADRDVRRLSYDAAKKRRQRALQRVREYLQREGLDLVDLLASDDP